MANTFQQIREKINAPGWILILLAIGWIISFAITTRLVDNTTFVNQTGNYSVIDGRIADAPQSIVRVEMSPDNLTALVTYTTTSIKYFANSKVPNSEVRLEQAFIPIIFFILFIAYLMRSAMGVGKPLDLEDAKRIVREWHNKVNNVDTALTGELIFGTTRLRTYKHSNWEFRKWYIGAMIRYADEREQYLLITVVPEGTYRGYLDYSFRDIEFTGENTCPNCGKYYDIKYVDMTDFRQQREAMGFPMRAGR